MKIYLAHALTGAPEEFRQRMLALRVALNAIPDVKVLEFNWIPGKGPDKSKNTYLYDMGHVRRADLMVGVLDFPSIGLGMEIQERCRREDPLFLFHQLGSPVSRIVTDCVAWHRHDPILSSADHLAELRDPVIYYEDAEIVDVVSKWIRVRTPSMSFGSIDETIG